VPANSKILILNRQNKVKIPAGARLLIKRCCNAVLKHEKIQTPVEISVSFTDDVGIKELNTSFRGLNRPTDVLSFPLTENFDLRADEKSGFCILGDIVISIERAVEQAELYGHSLEREIGFLTVHSMLHLLGYDHEVGGIKARIMREKEEMILQDLGLSRDSTYLKK
jgi:probable rRNA maturation factor